MTEIELKFQVPESSRQTVEAAIMTTEAKRTRLQAIYFDTIDRRLAAAGIAVRLRKEGRRWVQTVKAGGAHAMERLEHNVPVTGVTASALPSLDLQRHAGSPAAALLAQALAPRGDETAPEPVALYRTDIWRSHRLQRTRSGVVELAFDDGVILAEGRRWPICELEVELVSGATAAVIDVAQRWVAQHGLWLDVRSKAERGDRLARTDLCGPAPQAKRPFLHPDMSADEARREALTGCLTHILPNASEVASGDFSAEHLHQLRVGLRRLGSALRLFDGWSAPVDPAWVETLSTLRRELGRVRDRQLLVTALLPLLAEAGAPTSSLPVADNPGDAATLVRGASVMKSLLGLQKFVLGPLAETPAELPPVEEVSDRLEHWHMQVRRAAASRDELDDSGRHELRTRVKRLRYAVELTANLYGRKKVSRYLDLLIPLQDTLGRSHDAVTSMQAAREMTDHEPRAWFAVGWLSRQRQSLEGDCRDALKRFRKAAPFWHGD